MKKDQKKTSKRKTAASSTKSSPVREKSVYANFLPYWHKLEKIVAASPIGTAKNIFEDFSASLSEKSPEELAELSHRFEKDSPRRCFGSLDKKNQANFVAALSNLTSRLSDGIIFAPKSSIVELEAAIGALEARLDAMEMKNATATLEEETATTGSSSGTRTFSPAYYAKSREND